MQFQFILEGRRVKGSRQRSSTIRLSRIVLYIMITTDNYYTSLTHRIVSLSTMLFSSIDQKFPCGIPGPQCLLCYFPVASKRHGRGPSLLSSIDPHLQSRISGPQYLSFYFPAAIRSFKMVFQNLIVSLVTLQHCSAPFKWYSRVSKPALLLSSSDQHRPRGIAGPQCLFCYCWSGKTLALDGP